MPSSNSELSDREQEILRLVATGASNKEIAQRLFITTNTVKVHLRNIFGKIGVVSRTEAAMYAVNAGLVSRVAQDIPSESVDKDELPPGSNATISEAEGISVGGRRRLIFFDKIWMRVAGYILIPVAMVILIWLVNLSRSSEVPITTDQVGITPTMTNWRMLPALSQARFSLAVVAYENQIYAIGGMTGQGVSDAVDIYDPVSDIWKTGKFKPLAVKDIQAVVIGGMIYVPGGETTQGQITDQLEIYDPSQNTWSTGADLPVPLSAYALVAFDGRMYLFGGWDGNHVLNSVYRYDPEQDDWTTMPSMPTARRYLGAAVSGRRVFLIGGEYNATALRTNEIFSPDQAKNPQAAWQTGMPLPEAMYGMGMTSVADIIYVVGGTGIVAMQYGVLVYDQNQGWRGIPEQPSEQITFLGLTSLSTNLFALGGQVDGQPSDRCYSYQAVYTLSLPLIIK